MAGSTTLTQGWLGSFSTEGAHNHHSLLRPHVHTREGGNMEHIFTDDAPEEFLDPVTMVLMRDPVVLPSGETYERETIRKN